MNGMVDKSNRFCMWQLWQKYKTKRIAGAHSDGFSSRRAKHFPHNAEQKGKLIFTFVHTVYIRAQDNGVQRR